MSIRIDFLSNTRSVVRDAATLADTFDTVVDSLDDVARAAHRSGDDVSDAYTDAARDGERAADRLERSFREASEATARSSQQGAQHMTRNTEEATRRSSESLHELGNEARQNASETFSSFDGSAQSFADGIQGTLGGIVSSLGPIGAAAGAAGALGIGLITSGIQGAEAENENFRQDVGDLATDLIETGSRGSASISKIADKLKELATNGDASGVTLAKLNDIANDAQGSYKDLAQAYAGNGKQLDRLVEKYRDQKAALEASNKEEQKGLAYRDQVGGDDPRIRSTQTYIDYLTKAQKKQREAARDLRLFEESGGAAMQALADATQSYADSVQSAYADAGSNVQDYVEKGVFNLDKYQKATEKNAQAIVDYTSNMADAQALLAKGGHDRAISYLESLGPDAAPLIAAFIKAPAAQQGELEKTWDTLGGAASTSFGTSLQSKLNAQVPVQRVRLEADDGPLLNRLAFLKNNPTSIPVPLIAVPGLGSGVKRNP